MTPWSPGQTIHPSVPGQQPFLQAGRTAGCPRPGRQKADDSSVCVPGTCSGRGCLSQGQAGGGPAWSKGLGGGLGQQTLLHPCKSVGMEFINQESPKWRAETSLHCCCAQWLYTLQKIPWIASSKPVSTPIPALKLQSIPASQQAQERGKKGSRDRIKHAPTSWPAKPACMPGQHRGAAGQRTGIWQRCAWGHSPGG